MFCSGDDIFEFLNITRPLEVVNLKETGHTPGINLRGAKKHRIVIETGVRADVSNPNFKYFHHVAELVAVLAIYENVTLVAVFKKNREAFLSEDATSDKFSTVISSL